MGYELLIAEKPSAAQKIAAALADGKLSKKARKKVPYYELKHNGKDIVVCAAVGHLYTLAEKGKGTWNYPVFDIQWISGSKDAGYIKDYIDNISELSKNATEFTICTDFDVEGELIGFNALRYACKQKDGNRMKFSTLTKGDLIEAYDQKLKHIDWGQAHAGETRHKLDWFYGINLSRALTDSIKAAHSFRVMSIGRVQGPSLKMIVDREHEITAFKPVSYWQIQLIGDAKKKEIEAWHVEDKFWDKTKADAVFKKVKAEKEALVAEVKRQNGKQQPPFPFDLTTLQTETYAHHGINPKETLSHAQKLYLAGVISYPRTSSQQLTPKLGFHKILTELKKQKEFTVLCEKLLEKKTLNPNNGPKTDPAHPAIYPTGVAPKELTPREAKVYDLIVKRFMATFGEPALREQMTIVLDVKKEKFKAQGRRTLEPGWHIFYQPYIKQKEIELPAVAEKDIVSVKKLTLLDKETQPPKRYTQSSIIRELEKRNLGTKATRAEIVDTLFKRGYAEGKQITATQLGISTVETLEKYSPRILDEALTRSFEEDMEKIREGNEKPDKVLETAKKVLVGLLDEFKIKEKNIGESLLKAVREAQDHANTIAACPVCKKGTIKITMNKKTKQKFLGCDKYPDCQTTYPLPQNALIKATEKNCEKCTFPQVLVIRRKARPQVFCVNPQCPTKLLEAAEQKKMEKQSEQHKKKCSDCGKDLILRRSFYGQFWGCSGYPSCRHIEKIDNGKKESTAKK
ncbi:MAG TPA: DNA topoisomerase I [Candidatus Nanoarchaeia archaeon]|nr:DNA topoisomerase I [Candidatus Nanoarchaeia archaeon]